MQNLILITNSYPFGLKEASFLRPEVKALAKCFRMTVVSRNVRDEQTSELPEGTEIYRYDSRKGYAPIQLLPRVLFSKAIYQEIVRLIREKQFNFTRLKKALRYCMRAHHFAAYLQKIREKIPGDAVLYTYWNDYSVFSASMVKRKGDKLISRAHRVDLYLRAENNQYLPMKAISNAKTDLLACIGAEGKAYFQAHFSEDVPVEVFRLGVPEQARRSPFREENGISVLSFSYLSPVKRVERIAEALALIGADVPIQWTHIGDGTEHEKVLLAAQRLLSQKANVSYRFLGAMHNADAMRCIAETQFDFLLNVSASEGIPVTMMESMSFGIPVIGTDVGGVREIVQNGENGFLLSAEAPPQEVADAILQYAQLPFSEKCALRTKAYAFWENNYNAEKNFGHFADAIKEA